MIYFGVSAGTAASHLDLAVAQILGAGAGLLLLAGLWTPVTGAVVAVIETWVALSYTASPSMPLMLAVLGASLAMIGPGAWSIDARIFGRKQINPDLPR